MTNQINTEAKKVKTDNKISENYQTVKHFQASDVETDIICIVRA